MSVRHLDGHHRRTLEKIFEHPVSHNIEWKDVLSLLREVGTVDARHDGKIAMSIGAEKEVIERPHGKSVDADLVVTLRHVLGNAGYRPL